MTVNQGNTKSGGWGGVSICKVGMLNKHLYANRFNQVRKRETNDTGERGQNYRKTVLEKMTQKEI